MPADKIIARIQAKMDANRSETEEWCEDNRYDCWEPVFDPNPFRRLIEDFLKEGWTSNEVVTYILFTEEVDPTISEDDALNGMARLRKRVGARLNAE